MGFFVFLVSVYLWALEGNEGYHLHPEGEAGHDAHPPAKH